MTFLWSPVSGFIALSPAGSLHTSSFLNLFLVHVKLFQCFYNPLAYDKNYRIFKARVLPFCTCTHKWDLGYNLIQRTFVQFAQNWTPEMSGCGYKAQHTTVTEPCTDLARSCSTDGCCAAGCVQLTAVVLHDLLPWWFITLTTYHDYSLPCWFVILMIRYLDSLPWCQLEVPPEPWKGCAQSGDSEAWTSAEVQRSGWCRQTSHGCPSGCWQTDQWERRTLPPCTPGTQLSAWGETQTTTEWIFPQRQ